MVAVEMMSPAFYGFLAEVCRLLEFVVGGLTDFRFLDIFNSYFLSVFNVSSTGNYLRDTALRSLQVPARQHTPKSVLHMNREEYQLIWFILLSMQYKSQFNCTVHSIRFKTTLTLRGF